MDEKIVSLFIDATLKVMETMAFVTPTIGETLDWDNANAVGEVVGIVGLTNEADNIRGFMTVGFTEGSICQVVSNMLGEDITKLCDEVREAVGEIANMISGQARQGLSAKGIKLQASLPSVVSGKDLTVDGIFKNPMVMIKFAVDNGPFEVGICMDGIS